MTRELIMNELVARGYEVQATDVIKNGVERKGIIIGGGDVRPTIYTDQYEICDNVYKVVDEIIDIYGEAIKMIPTIDTNNLTSWDYVKTKLQLCIQRKGNEDIIKRDFLDLEMYVRVIADVNNDNIGSFKVKPEHLEKYGVTDDVLFHAAVDCTRPTVEVRDMMEMLISMGMDKDEIMAQGNPPMIVVTNKYSTNGASSIYFLDVLKEIADRYESDLAIIPSSIHECILHPVDDTVDFRTFDEMICEVNETQVAPEEVLSNHAYRFNRDECRITYYNKSDM